MSDITLALTALIIFIALAFSGIKIWAKNDLCSTYYPEMSRVTCLVSDSTLPQRRNR